MKTKHLLPFLFAALVLSGCKKDEEKEELDISPARDMALINGAYSDAFSMVDRVGKSEPGLRNNYGLPDCATVIFQDTVQFPYTLTIDFGENNCEDDNGVPRRGKIHVSITGPYQEEGTIISTTLEDYHVYDHHLQGSREVTNLGENENSNVHFSVVEEDVSLTAPNNEWTSYWESNRNREWAEGKDSWWWWLDDVYAITGDANGISRNGVPYTINITNPLIVKIGCPWVVEGALDLLPQNSSVLTLDYGDGTCDASAKVIVEGNEYVISLY